MSTELPITDVSNEVSASGCGCGCTDAELPALDVRPIPHALRHGAVFGALSALRPGSAMVLIAPHDPKPLLAQIAEREGDAVEVTYLVEGPDAWQLRLARR
ncbi:DUF2249 domain-containing protein [Calidifontibacter indicus]|uniref:DUF2249 domain-containing protein n=1 Tax=Calidifontibacter indicus TaxID=419650 RepID=UPI003D70BAC0